MPDLFATASKLQIALDKMKNFLGPVPLSVEVDMRKISPDEANVRGRRAQAEALMNSGEFRKAADRFIQLVDVMARSGHSLVEMSMARRKAAKALDAAGDKTAAKVQSVLAELDLARFNYDHGNYKQAAEILIGVGRTILADPLHLNEFRDRTVFRFKDTVSTWFHSTVLQHRLSAITDIDLRVTLENIAARMGEFGWESGRNEVLENDALREARARLDAAIRDERAVSNNLPALVARGDRADAPGVERPEGPKPKGRIVRALEWARRLRRGRGK
jgi:hypothetical protein